MRYEIKGNKKPLPFDNHHTEWISNIVGTSNNMYLFSSGGDQKVFQWDVK